MLRRCSPKKARAHTRNLCRNDLYFLLRYILRRKDLDHPWLFDRCREVQAQPDEMLDLWAREHCKSSIITFGKLIQDILRTHGEDAVDDYGGELTAGIFSYSRPAAKAFLVSIKRELESNEVLKGLFPDILYANPKKESPMWSLDGGLVVKRKDNPKEATVEAWGVVEGQPTGRHFRLLNYDDVVTPDSVTSPEMIAKTTEALKVSYNLGARGGVRRFIGTRYHYNDSYRELIERKTVTPRIHPATHNGKEDGRPVLLSRELLAKKRRDMGPYVFACQMLLNPTASSLTNFRRSWLRFWIPINLAGFNKYLLCDPAGSKNKSSDYTVFAVIGLGPDRNYYLLDMIRDRLSLSERTNALFALHQQYRPLAVGYEKYGLQSDIEHFEEVMADRNYRFEITPLGGNMAKNARIERLQPIFEQKRFYIPEKLIKSGKNGQRDLTQEFINEEYLEYPLPRHDDMLDCISRIKDPDLEATFPMAAPVDDDIIHRGNWQTL